MIFFETGLNIELNIGASRSGSFSRDSALNFYLTHGNCTEMLGREKIKAPTCTTRIIKKMSKITFEIGSQNS